MKRTGRPERVLALAACLAAIAVGCSDGSTSDPTVATDGTVAPADPPATGAPQPPPADPMASADIATLFIGASTPEEAAAASATLASDALIGLAGITSVSDIEAWFAWNRAIGFQTTATRCETVSAGGILCHYTYDSPWMRAAGISPVGGNSMTFTIVDGAITAVSENLSFEPFAPVWDGFKTWVRRSHPGRLDQILTSDDLPVLTDEALERWKLFSAQYTDSFALEALGNSFLDAFLSFDREALRDIGGPAKDLGPELYLQEFSAASNYVASDRRCAPTVLRVTCTMVGTDDIADALGGVTYTDTFVIEVSGDTIRSVEWSTDSAPAGVFDGFFAWLQTTHQDIFATGGACEGFFEGGDTPGECALAFLDRVEDYLDA